MERLFIQRIEKIVNGHPDFAEKLVYPKDKVLAMLYDYFYPKDSDNNIIMSMFMILYGYLNIHGHTETEEVTCQFSSEALTIQTRSLPESMKEYSRLIDSSSSENSSNEILALSKMVPFFRDRVIEILKQENPDEDINQVVMKMSSRRKQNFLKAISTEYLEKLERGNK